MVIANIDKIVKNKFSTIYSTSVKEAKDIFWEIHLPKLTGKKLFDHIVYLMDEIEKLEGEADVFPIPSYVHNHSTEEWLLRSFATRTMLLNVDETDYLHKGVVIGTLKSELVQKLHNL